jgi:hypothetical protein
MSPSASWEKNISQAGALECSIVNSIATTLFLWIMDFQHSAHAFVLSHVNKPTFIWSDHHKAPPPQLLQKQASQFIWIVYGNETH